MTSGFYIIIKSNDRNNSRGELYSFFVKEAHFALSLIHI